MRTYVKENSQVAPNAIISFGNTWKRSLQQKRLK